MGIRTKTLVTVILVGAVVGVLALTIQNPQLFKGQIFNQDDDESVTEESQDKLLPDLSVDLEIILPENEEENLVVEATMENIGEGQIEGGTPFVYAIYINDIEVFSNSDSYSELLPGDAFSFKYPISKTIYQYPDQGTVKLVVDSENAIEESNEDNNEIVKEYNL